MTAGALDGAVELLHVPFERAFRVELIDPVVRLHNAVLVESAPDAVEVRMEGAVRLFARELRIEVLDGLFLANPLAVRKQQEEHLLRARTRPLFVAQFAPGD